MLFLHQYLDQIRLRFIAWAVCPVFSLLWPVRTLWFSVSLV